MPEGEIRIDRRKHRRVEKVLRVAYKVMPREEAEEESAEEAGEEIKVIDEKVEELVAGDIKLKEDEALPKDVPIKRKKKVK